MKRLIIAGVCLLTIAPLFTCAKKSDSNSKQTGLFALVALLPRKTVTGSTTAVSNAQGASAGVSAAAPSSSQGYSLIIETVKDRMLAEARGRAYEKFPMLPGVIPTNYLCNGGSCSGASGSSSIVLTGSQTCPSGGSVTANSVTTHGSATSSGGTTTLNFSMNGPFTFASCVTAYADWSQFPVLVSVPVTLNGALTTAGTMTSTITAVGATSISVAQVNSMTYTSSNWQVNGSTAAGLNVTDSTNMSYTESNITSSVNGSLMTIGFTFTGTGTYAVSGTYAGSPVVVSVPINGTSVCSFVMNTSTFTLVSGGCT